MTLIDNIKKGKKVNWDSKKHHHPINELVKDSPGMGADTIAEKLKDEGFEPVSLEPDAGDDPIGYNLAVAAYLNKHKKEIEEFRILPHYVAHIGRWYADKCNMRKGAELVHSENGNYHMLFIKKH